MARQARKASSAGAIALREGAREDFAAVLDKLDSVLRSAPKIFPSGIELIKLTVKAGPDIEFSVVLAGKDAPKVDASDPASAPAESATRS